MGVQQRRQQRFYDNLDEKKKQSNTQKNQSGSSSKTTTSKNNQKASTGKLSYTTPAKSTKNLSAVSSGLPSSSGSSKKRNTVTNTTEQAIKQYSVPLNSDTMRRPSSMKDLTPAERSAYSSLQERLDTYLKSADKTQRLAANRYKNGYSDSYHGDTLNYLKSVSNSIPRDSTSYMTLKSNLETFRNINGDKWTDEALKALEDANSMYKSLYNTAKDDYNYYSSFSGSEDFKIQKHKSDRAKLGETMTAADIQKKIDSIKSEQETYRNGRKWYELINDSKNQTYDDDLIYYQNLLKNRQYSALKNNSDFAELSAKGKALENPTQSYSDRPKVIIGNKYIGGKPIQNIATYSKDPLNAADGRVGSKTQMTDEEVDIYSYLLMKEGEDSANAYLKYLEPTLNQRLGQKVESGVSDWAKESPVASSVASVGLNLLSGSAYIEDALNKITGKPIDTYSGAHMPSRMTSAIRNSVSEEIDSDEGRFFYTNGMSVVDSLARYALTGNFSKGASILNKALGYGLIGSGTAASTIIDSKEKGLTDSQSFLLGSIAGAAEIITEKVSLDALLDKTSLGKNAVGYFLKNVLAEGSEEVGSDVINLVADVLVSKDKSEWNQTIANYKNRGFTDKEAFWRSVKDEAEQMGESFLGGALSGGVMSGGGIGINAVANSQYNKNVGRAVKDYGNVNELVDYAKNIDKRSLAYKFAQQISGVNNTLQAQDPSVENNQAESDMIIPIKNRVEYRLQSLGETGNVDALSDAVVKSINNQSLTRAERNIISLSKPAKTIINEFKAADKASSDRNIGKMYRNVSETYEGRIFNQAQGRIAERLKELGETEDIDKLAAIVKKSAYGAKLSKKEAAVLDNSPAGKRAVSEYKSIFSPEKGEYSNNWLAGTDTVRDFERISSMTESHISPKVTVKSTGKTVEVKGVKAVDDKGDVTFKLSDGETVKQDEVEFENGTDSELYIRSAKYGSLGAETFVNMYNGGDINKYDSAFSALYNYGKADPDGKLWESDNVSVSLGWLNPAQAKAAYGLGQAYAKNQLESAQARIDNKRANFKVENNSSQIGSQGASGVVDTSKIDVDALSEKQKASIGVLENISAVTNGTLKFSLFESEVKNKERTGANGWYDAQTNTIYLDVEAGIDDIEKHGELDRAMLRTASHELTHFVEQWSPSQYNNLRNFVYDTLNSQDANTVKRLIATQRANAEAAGHNLSYDDASREVVADACEMLLKDSNAVKNLAKENMTLAQKIKAWIDDFVKKMKKAFEGVSAKSEEARILEESIDGWSEIQKLWDDALEDAMRASTESGTLNKNSVENNIGVEYSKRSRYDEYTSLVMQWSNSAGTKAGDTKIFYKNSGDYRLLEADGNGGYVEIARGTYKKVSEIHGRLFGENDRSIRGNTKEFRIQQGRSNGNRSVRGRKRTDDDGNSGQTGGKTVQGDNTGSDEHNRSGDKRDSVKNQFSLRSNVEETKELVAVHNMTADELHKSLQLGGLPMPSVAVIKAKQGHSEYGEVSLVFSKDVIDPKLNRYNKVYGGDAWTPVYPTIEYKVNDKVAENIRNTYYDLYREYGADEARPLYNFAHDLESQLNNNQGESGLIEKLKDDTKLMQLYFLQSGKGKVEPVIKETVTELSDVEAETFDYMIKALGNDVINQIITPDGETPMKHRKAYFEKYGEQIKDAYSQMLRDNYQFNDEGVTNTLNNTSQYEFFKLIKNIYQYLKHGKTTVRTETDYNATNEAIKKAAESSGYSQWVESLFKGVEQKSGIRNNTDSYTASGNRRSWEALHWENNLENVVKAMRTEENGSGTFFSGQAIWAVSAKEYKSIDDVKADKDRLKSLPEEEYSKIKNGFGMRFQEIAESIMDKNESNPIIAVDNAMECIVDAVRRSKTKSGILKELKQYKQLDVTQTTVDDIVALVTDISNMPTEYFEAKPQRAVMFDEVATAVVPDNISDTLRNELSEQGVNYVEYESGNEQSRLSALNSLENVRFSFRNSINGTANDKLLPYDEELKGYITKSGNYIVDSFDKLKDFVNLAFEKSDVKATAYFGIIDTQTLSKIEKSVPNIPKELNGTLFKKNKNYSVAVRLDSIRHLVDDKKLMTREDVVDYLDRLADTIVDFDSVNFSYYEEGGSKNKGLLFKKTFTDGTLVSYQIISNKKRSLTLQTSYLESGDYQKKKKFAETSPWTESLAKTVEKPSDTPEAAVGQTSDNSISNNSENVKQFSLRFAKELKKEYNSTLSTDEIQKCLDYIESMQNDISSSRDYEHVWGRVLDFAKAILKTSKDLDVENQAKAQELQELKEYFKGMKFKLTPEVRQEVEYIYGDFKAFRDMMFGKRVYFSADAPFSLDSYWGEICERFPTVFDPDTNPADQPKALADAFDVTVKEGIDESSEYFDEMAKALADRIIDSMPAPGQSVSSNVNLRTDVNLTDRELLANALMSVAKNEVERDYLTRYQQQIKDLNEKNKQASDLRRQIHDISFTKGSDRSQLASLKNKAEIIESQIQRADKRLLSLEATKALKDVAEREKKQAVQKAKEQGKTKLKNYRENQKAAVIRKGIARIKLDLSHRLLTPTDGKYIPPYLVRGMIDVCNAINTDTGVTAPDGSKTKAQQRRDDLKTALFNLKIGYEKLKDLPDPNYSSEYDKAVSDELDKLIEAVDGKRVNEMTYTQLEQVYESLKTIKGTLRDANYQIGLDEKISNAEIGKAIVIEQSEIDRSKKGFKKLVQMYGDAVSWQAISPMRAILRMSGYNKDSQLYHLAEQLNRGQRKKDIFVMESHKMFEPLTQGENKKKYQQAIEKAIDFGITDVDGNPVYMSEMTAMQLVMSWERETASGGKLSHLYQSGAVIPDHKLLMNGKVRDAVSAENAQRIDVNQSVINQISAKLDEWDKQYMQTAREFFDKKSKQAINETSRIVSHRDIATSVKYIPFKVDEDFVHKDEISDKDKNRPTLKSMGMLKETVRNAGQPLVMTSLNHILNDQIESVAKYYGLAVPVRNFNKVWNYMSNNEVSVRKSITKNWGKNGISLIDNAIKDLQSPRVSERSKILDTANSAFVRSVLNSNISVTLKQLSALPSAYAVLNQRFTPGYVYGQFLKVCNPKTYQRVIGEIDKYTASHWNRRQGLSTQELGDIATSMGRIKRLNDKIPAAFNPTKWIQGMDCLVTASFWDMCKKDIEKTGEYRIDSAEYWNAVKELYDMVIEETQAVYDVMHRPEILKTTNALTRQIFMFRSESLQHSGMIFEKYGNFAVNRDSESKREFAKACYAQFSSALSFASLTLIGAAILHKMNPYRDDDEELTPQSILIEFMNDLTNVLADLIAPIGGAQLQEFIYGALTDSMYADGSLAVPAVDFVNDFVKSVANIYKAFKAEDFDKGKVLKSVEDLVFKFAGLFGIPLNNAKNIVKAFVLHIEDAVNGEFGSFEAGVERENSVNYHRAIEAVIDGDTQKYKEVYDELTDNGVTPDKIANGLKEQIKKYYLDGELNDKEAIKMLVKYAGADDENDAHWILKQWKETEKHSDDEDYSFSVYGDLDTAVLSGKDIESAVSELLKHGYDEDKVSDEIKETAKEAYTEGKMSKTDAEKILSKYIELDDNEIYWLMDEWDYYRENPNAESKSYKKYADLYEVVDKGGNADIAGTVKVYMDNGVSKKSIGDTLTKHYKEQYIKLYNTNKTQAATLKNSLLRAYYAAGYDWDTRSKNIDKWLEQ